MYTVCELGLWIIVYRIVILLDVWTCILQEEVIERSIQQSRPSGQRHRPKKVNRVGQTIVFPQEWDQPSAW